MTHKVTTCQTISYGNKKNKFFSRIQRRSKAYKRLLSEGYNPTELYNWLAQQKKLDTIAYRLMNYILFLASKNVHAFPSISFLQQTLHQDGAVPHEKSICRVTRILADMGILRKWYRGMRKSVALLLNRIFNNPVLQYLIAPLFPFMSRLSFNIIYPTLSDCRESFVYRSICLFATDVTYNKYTEYILKKRSIRESIKREILSKKEEFNLTYAYARAGSPPREDFSQKRDKSPSKGMQSIGSVIKDVFGEQRAEFRSSSKPTESAKPVVKKLFVLPEQPKTVGELLALKFKEHEYEHNLTRFSQQDSYGETTSGYYDPLEDESVWEDEDGDDYT